jgi:prepilin-type N-terminal cleavage/methylation domain-containing protein
MDHALVRDARGFSLVEVMVSLAILAFGLLSLASIFAAGINKASASSADVLAKEKATEAVENVFTLRDTGLLPWSAVRNVTGVGYGGGVFLDGPQSLRAPGADGLVGTADDGAVLTIRRPGADGQLGNADDEIVPLTTYTREIQITRAPQPAGLDTLRQIRVIVTYNVAGQTRTYTVTTFISSYN